MQSTRTDGRFVWAEYQRTRIRKRRTTMDPDESTPVERAIFDLDDDDPESADIDGTDNPRSYEVEPYGDREGPIDYREADPRFD